MAARAAALARVVKALPDGAGPRLTTRQTPGATSRPACPRHPANVLPVRRSPLGRPLVGRLGRLERLASRATGPGLITSATAYAARTRARSRSTA